MSDPPPPGCGGSTEAAAPSGDGDAGAEAEALLVALQPRRGDHRRRHRRGDLLGSPPLHRQHRQALGAQQRPATTELAEDIISNVDGGEPETILILGSDKRAESGRRTRVAPTRRSCCGSTPNKNLISVMSIPRDLEGRNPRLRDRQVQRRLHLRRAEADPEGGQGTDRAEDQPRGQHRLPRLRPRGRRDRLRLHRRRPPLLPLERRPAAPQNSMRKSTSSRATRSSAARKRSQYVRYRHTDTDIVRSARQQDFLSQARAPGLADAT